MASSTKQQQLLLQRKGKAVAEKGAPAAAEKVVVAVRAATREISKTAIVWALTHVVQPGGNIILLVVIPSQSSGIVPFPCNHMFPLKMHFCCTEVSLICSLASLSPRLSASLSFVSVALNAPLFPSISGRKFWGFPLFAGDCASGHKTMLDQKSDISELCSQMMLKLHDVYDANKVWIQCSCLCRCLLESC